MQKIINNKYSEKLIRNLKKLIENINKYVEKKVLSVRYLLKFTSLIKINLIKKNSLKERSIQS